MNIIKDFAMWDQITKRPGSFFLDILGLKFEDFM
jgi:hypothetical protein